MTSKKREILCIVCMSCFVLSACGFGRYVLSTISPEMVRDLGVDYEFIGRMSAFSSAAYMSFSLLAGVLCRYVSGRFLVTAAMLLSVVSLFAMSIVSAPWLLLLFIFLLGGCAAATWVAMVDVLAEDVRPEKEGVSIGIILSGLSVSIIGNGFLVPEILLHGSWRTVWLACGIIGAVLAAACTPML